MPSTAKSKKTLTLRHRFPTYAPAAPVLTMCGIVRPEAVVVNCNESAAMADASLSLVRDLTGRPREAENP